MRNKFIPVLMGVLLLSSSVFATGINVFINDGAITERDGTTALTPATNYHPYGSKLEFYYNTLPAPNVPSARLSVSLDPVTGQYTKSGAQNKYALLSQDGGVMYVRAWKGTVTQAAAGDNYYGWASHSVAAGTTLPLAWDCAISTNYKAAAPYVPSIGAIGESLVRHGSSMTLTLTVPVIAGTGSDGLREVTDYSVIVTNPSGEVSTQHGATVTLTGTSIIPGTYHFQPTATNYWGATTGTEITYITLGTLGLVGASNSLSINYTFVASPGSWSINPIAYSFGSCESGTVSKVAQLVARINTTAGSNVVNAVGWWNRDMQRAAGYTITYSASSVANYIPIGTAAASGNEPLRQDYCYQISVSNSVSAPTHLTGTRVNP